MSNPTTKNCPASDVRDIPALYSLESSEDGKQWTSVQEKYHCSDAPVGSPFRRRPITRDRLQDIQREAEFHSHRFRHVRIVHRAQRSQ